MPIGFLPLPIADRTKRVDAALATETDSAFAVGALKTQGAGLASESDSALAAAATRSHAVGLASETDNAFAATVRRSLAAGLATESDSAFVVGAEKTCTVGLASEADSALASTAVRLVTLGLAIETDIVLAVTRAPFPKDLCYLVEADSYEGVGESPPYLPSPLGTVPLAALPFGFSPDIVVTHRWSDRGYLTHADDTPALTPYPGRALVPLALDRSIPLTPEEAARSGLGVGEIAIAARDGGADQAATFAIDGRPVRVKIGDRAGPLSAFRTIFNGRGVAWRPTADALQIEVRDNTFRLETALADLYAGSGGAAGTVENKDRPIPQCYGDCFDVAPVLLNTLLIYQFHDRLANAVNACYVRGAAIVDSGFAAASYAALAAATTGPPGGGADIEEGEYGVALTATGSYIRLGSQPDGPVTLDVEGDAHAASGGYIATPVAIARRLLLDRGGLDTADIDEDAITAAIAAVPGVAGIYFTDPVQVDQAVSAVCAGAFLFWQQRRDGRIFIGRLEEPAASADFELGVLDLLEEPERLPLPEIIEPCNWRRRVGYARCWTPQTQNLAGALSADRVQFLAEPFRVASSADTTRRLRNQLAKDPPPIGSIFRDEADAEDLAALMIALYTPARIALQVVVPARLHTVDLDQTARLTFPRYGLAAGRNFRVVHVEDRCDARAMTLTLFG